VVDRSGLFLWIFVKNGDLFLWIILFLYLCVIRITRKVQNLNFDLKEADFREDEVAFTPRIRSFKDERELQNDALRVVSGEFSKALKSAKEYKKRVENAYKKG